MLAASSKRDPERPRGYRCVVEKQFVEVAHAKEQQGIGLLLLGGEPLGDNGGRGHRAVVRRRAANVKAFSLSRVEREREQA